MGAMARLLTVAVVAFLCSYARSEEDKTKDEMLDEIWRKFVPEGQEFMTKEQLFALISKTHPDYSKDFPPADQDYEAIVKAVQGDAEKGLTKEQLLKVYMLDTDNKDSLKEDHETSNCYATQVSFATEINLCSNAG